MSVTMPAFTLALRRVEHCAKPTVPPKDLNYGTKSSSYPLIFRKRWLTKRRRAVTTATRSADIEKRAWTDTGPICSPVPAPATARKLKVDVDESNHGVRMSRSWRGKAYQLTKTWFRRSIPIAIIPRDTQITIPPSTIGYFG
jgi:hypothetical protein